MMRMSVARFCAPRVRHVLLAQLFTTLNVASPASALPMTPSQVLGDWEVTRLLVPDGFSNMRRFMKPDDANMMGRKYTFQQKSVTYNDETTACTFDASQSKRIVPMKALFAGDGVARPKLIRDRFYRRMKHYALGSLAQERVAIYAYHCPVTDNDNGQINNSGNWFAATRDTIIWPQSPDALVLLKRQPTKPTAEQAKFCASVTSPSDKIVCTDREMWLMKVFTDTYRDCGEPIAPGPPDELRAELDSLVVKRNACNGERKCVYTTLDEHASLLAQMIASTEQCDEAKKKQQK